MMESLNIPLNEQTTRRSSWRVVWILGIAIPFITIFWVAFRLASHVDQVSSFAPVESTESVLIFKTGRTTRLLTRYLGNETAFVGDPWVLGDFIKNSKHALSLHYNDSELVGITVDTRISGVFKNNLISRGFYVTENGRKTLISKTEKSRDPQVRLQTQFIFPSNNGLFLTNTNQRVEKSAMSINAQGIKIRQKNPQISQIPIFSYPDSLEVIAFAPLSDTDFQLLPTVNIHDFLVLIGKDDRGDVFFISYEAPNIEVDRMADLGSAIMGTGVVSTTALTLPDGSRVSELRSQQGSLTSHITSEEDYQEILLTNEQGEQVQIGNNSHTTVIANRPFAFPENMHAPESKCHRGLPYFVKPQELALMAYEPIPSPLLPTQGFFSLFSENAWGPKRAFLCW